MKFNIFNTKYLWSTVYHHCYVIYYGTGGGAQQRWKFLACLVLICVPPAIIIVAFVYWARYRCLCIIGKTAFTLQHIKLILIIFIIIIFLSFITAELVSKVTCSHSNGNNMEYPMHAAFELQDKPGELLKLLTILKVSSLFM